MPHPGRELRAGQPRKDVSTGSHQEGVNLTAFIRVAEIRRAVPAPGSGEGVKAGPHVVGVAGGGAASDSSEAKRALTVQLQAQLRCLPRNEAACGCSQELRL